MQRVTQDAEAELAELNQELQVEFGREAVAGARGRGDGDGRRIFSSTSARAVSSGPNRSLRPDAGRRRQAQRTCPLTTPEPAASRRGARGAAPGWTARMGPCTLAPAVSKPPSPVSLDIPVLLERLNHRYPSLLVDSVVEHEPGRRVTAVKNVTVNEEYFQGHFAGNPLMPGVMMIETLVQVATLLLLGGSGDTPTSRAVLRGVNNAKFRRQVFPGDRLCLEVTLRERGEHHAVAYGMATVAGRSVAEAELLVGIEESTYVDATAKVHPACRPRAEYDRRSPRLHRRRCSVGDAGVASARRPSSTGTRSSAPAARSFPSRRSASSRRISRYEGEETRLVIGERNVIREFVTIHRGTRGGGGLTLIGDDNVFHGLRARGARLHRRPQDDLRQWRDGRRSRGRRGRGDHQRAVRRAPVLPRRPAGLP